MSKTQYLKVTFPFLVKTERSSLLLLTRKHCLVEKLLKSSKSVINLLLCENLEILLTNLNHKFDVAAPSETWTSDGKQNSLKSGTTDRYQSYLGTTGTNMKSGYGFFMKEGLRFQQRQDLSLSFKDNENKFQ